MGANGSRSRDQHGVGRDFRIKYGLKMASISETLVREFFEFRGFLVRQLRKYVGRERGEERQVDLLVYNPHPELGADPLPLELKASDVNRIAQGEVVVKGWHSETMSPSLLAGLDDLDKALGLEVFRSVSQGLNVAHGPVTRILVVPDLPTSAAARAGVFDALKKRGVDCVLTFRTVLSDLISHIECNRNYQRADVIQVIRILKVYGYLKEDAQLEFFQKRPRRGRSQAVERIGMPPPDDKGES